MKQLFSTFANGWPGIGLLVQRLLIGAALLNYGIIQMGQAHDIAIFGLSFIEATAGMFLIVGLSTALIAALTALIEVWSIWWSSGDSWIAIYLAILAASLAVIGPGAWSLDARLFGRKHMNIREL